MCFFVCVVFFVFVCLLILFCFCVCFVVCLFVFAGVLLLMLLFCLFVCCCFAQAEHCFGRNTEINPECVFLFCFCIEVRLARYSCAGCSQLGSQNAVCLSKGFALAGFKLCYF